MLTAQRQNGNSVFAPEVDNISQIRKLGKRRSLYCPACGAPVHFRGRQDGQKIWHFAHFQGEDCDLEDPDYRPESQEHQLLKWSLCQWLVEEYGTERAHVESPIKTGQFADVLLKLNESRIAFEIQRSALSPEDWLDRHNGYKSAGIRDEWVLVGDSHLRPKSGREPSKSESFELSPLARTIASKKGRLLWIDGTAITQLRDATGASSLPQARMIDVWAMETIASHYCKAKGSPWQYIRELQKQPFPKHPRYLLNLRPWQNRIQSGSLYTKGGSNGHFSLSDFRVAEEGTSTVALESPAASETEISEAWNWEEANLEWNSRLKSKSQQRRKVRRKVSRGEGNRSREATNNLLAEVGSVVYKNLLSLLSALNELKRSAEEESPEQIRSSECLPSGVRKWPVRCWTPLANLDVPLTWIFGSGQRLWQMRVYCTQFYHSYAKEYKSKHGIRSNGYSYIPTGYALKALSQAGILGRGEEVQSCLKSINREVDKIVAYSPAAQLEWIPDFRYRAGDQA